MKLFSIQIVGIPLPLIPSAIDTDDLVFFFRLKRNFRLNRFFIVF